MKALFLDRDGVVNVDTDYTYKIEEIEFIEGIFDIARTATDKGYKIFIVTNQAGIGRGFYTEEDYTLAKDYIENSFLKNGVAITKSYHCPYHPLHGIGKYKADSLDRKPNPGMLLRAKKEFNIVLEDSILIGDKETDIEAGINAGLRVKVMFNPKRQQIITMADYTIYDLLDIKKIL
jgi:D-glycero-D-manno-heptose 1,7-bisphosphate phosphatase